MRLSISLSLVVSALVCVACGGSGGAPVVNSPTFKLRALNDFVDVSRVSANVSGSPLLSSQPFGFTSLFTNFPVGHQSINYFDAGTNTLLATRSVDPQASGLYDAIGLGTSTHGRHILYFPASQATIVGETQVRIVNGDEDAPSVDIYVTPLGTKNVNGLTPQLSNVQYADDSVGYNSYLPAAYTIWFTPAGQPSTLLGGADETFVANTNITLLLLKTSSGLNVQLITDSGN